MKRDWPDIGFKIGLAFVYVGLALISGAGFYEFMVMFWPMLKGLAAIFAAGGALIITGFVVVVVAVECMKSKQDEKPCTATHVERER